MTNYTIAEQKNSYGQTKKDYHLHGNNYFDYSDWKSCALNEAKWDGSFFVGFAETGEFAVQPDGTSFKLYINGFKAEYPKFNCGVTKNND